MNTPGILNSVNLMQSQAPAARPNDPAASEVPFDQVLSREMADRSSTGEAAANAPESNSPVPQSQAQAPAAVKSKAPESSDGTEVAAKQPADSDPVPDAASAEMQALVNNLVQAAGVATDPNLLSRASVDVKLGTDTVRSIGSGKKIDLPASGGVAQLLDQTKPANPAGTQEIPNAVLTKPDGEGLPGKLESAALKDLQGKPQPAVMPDLPKALTAVVPDLPGKPQPAGVPDMPGMAQSAGVSDSQTKAQPAGFEELLAHAQATAAPEVQSKGRPANPSAIDPGLKPGTTDLAAGANRISESTPLQNASGVPKTLEIVGGLSAVPALELAAAKNREVAAVPSAAMLGQLQQATAFGSQAAGHVTEKLSPPVGSPGWDQALGQKVVWMVAGGIQSASLTLNPPDLGPMQVVLSVSNSQASASFTAAQPEVRQALEAAMPRLREMLADSGIQLGQSTVSAGTPNQYNTPGEQSQQASRHFSQTGATLDTSIPTLRPVVQTGGQGLIDTFA